MAKTGNHTQRSGRHGREGWITWILDQLENKHKSKLVRKWIAVLVDQIMDEGGLLTAPEKFVSSISELRPHPADSWGYRFVSRAAGDPVPAKSRQKANSKRKSSDKHDRRIKPGEPLIDLGAEGLVRVPMGDTTLPANKLDEKFDPYSILLDDAGFMLRGYDYVHERLVKEKKKKDKKGEVTVIPAHTIQRREPRKPEGDGAEDNLKRMTVDLSPGLSRAVQLMIESGLVDEAREILDALLPEMAKGLEDIYPGAKVVGCGWHVMSGQLHADFWVHSTKLEVHDLGEKAAPTLCRVWDPTGLAHQGPGPGICAWDRHMAALGEEMEALAPGTCREVREAMRRQEERAVLRGRPGLANRDIAIHRRFDEMAAGVLPEFFVRQGMEAYRSHLRAVYADGDPKLTAVVSDPERQKKYRRQVAEGLKAARKLARDAEKIRAEAAADLEKARDERRDMEKREADIRIAEGALDQRIKTAESLETTWTQLETALVTRETTIGDQEKALGQRINDVNTKESSLPGLARDAEVRGIQAAFEAVFPDRKPVSSSPVDIITEIKTGIKAVRDEAVKEAKIDAAAIRQAAKDEAAGTRKNLAKRVRGMRTRMMNRDRIRTKALAVIVLGADRVEALTKSGTKLLEPIQKRLEWFRTTLSVFGALVESAPPKGGPDTLVGKLVLQVKKLMSSPHAEPISKAPDQDLTI